MQTCGAYSINCRNGGNQVSVILCYCIVLGDSITTFVTIINTNQSHRALHHYVFLLFCMPSRYWLKGDKAGTLELFANVPGIPDNIRPSKAGGYWVAIAFARHPTRLWFYEFTATRPWIRRVLSKVSQLHPSLST